jgi:transposase
MSDGKGSPELKAIPAPCTEARFCEPMRASVNVEGYVGAGMTVARGWLEKAPKRAPPQLLGVQFKRRGNTETRMFNLCPFCGADIRFWMTAEERQAQAVARKEG